MSRKILLVFISCIVLILTLEVLMYIDGLKNLRDFFTGGLAGESGSPAEMFRKDEERKARKTSIVRGLGSRKYKIEEDADEPINPVQDYFDMFYQSNLDYLGSSETEEMAKGRLTSVGISSDDPLKLRKLTGSGYIGTDPEEFSSLIADDLTELGLSDKAIAGIVGSLDYESLGFTRYNEIDGPGVSAAQYTNMGGINNAERQKLINENDYDGLIDIGARKDAFLAFSKAKNQDSRTYKAFRDFMFYELQNSPESKVLRLLENVGSAEEAAQIFTNEFLRPASESANIPERKRRATKFFNRYFN